MRRSSIFGVVIVLGQMAACEHATQGPHAMAPVSPSLQAITTDTTFRLSPAERASVLPYFDVNALERLLSLVPPNARARTLASFQVSRPGESHGFLVRMGSPRMNAVLEEVWAPFWDGYSDEQMAGQPAEFPGRQLARARRAARAQPAQ